MKVKSFPLILIFTLTPAMWAQNPPAQAPASGPGAGQPRAERQQKMMEMHKKEMEATKADIEKLKSSLAQMKTNIAAIKDPPEKARWQANVDMWETVVSHMDRMQKQMASMGPDRTHAAGMGGQPQPPPSEQKPQ